MATGRGGPPSNIIGPVNPYLVNGKLKEDFEAATRRGDDYCKDQLFQEALRLYDEALRIAQCSPELYKEAAVIYSNKANVLLAQGQYLEAYTNAKAAINCDAGYLKGYLLAAMAIKEVSPNYMEESFVSFLQGCLLTTEVERKPYFLSQSVMLWKDMNDSQRQETYALLKDKEIQRSILEDVLRQLSENAEWKCIAWLLLGPDLPTDKPRASSNSGKESGIAEQCSTSKLNVRTVITFVKDSMRFDRKQDSVWLEEVLDVVLKNGFGKGFSEVHALVEIAALTECTNFLKAVAPAREVENEQNENKDTVFHVLTKLELFHKGGVLRKIVKAFAEKGYSLTLKDQQDKIAVEWLGLEYPFSVIKFFIPDTLDDPSAVKDVVRCLTKRACDKEDLKDAEAICNYAMNITPDPPAGLYSTLSRCYLEQKQFPKALEDALRELKFHPGSFEGHFCAGKAYYGKKGFHEANEYLYKALNLADREDKQIEVLMELANVHESSRNRSYAALAEHVTKMVAGGSGRLWALASYRLIQNGKMKSANVAYLMIKQSQTPYNPIEIDFRILCNLDAVKKNSWMIDLLSYFLQCNRNLEVVSCKEGDNWLHALVQLSLLGSNPNLLRDILFSSGQMMWTYFYEVNINCLDSDGNTALHVATMQQTLNWRTRYKVVKTLLFAGVDVEKTNSKGHKAARYLPKKENYCLSLILDWPRQAIGRDSNSRTSAQPKKHEQGQKKDSCPKCSSILAKARDLFSRHDLEAACKETKKLFQKKHKSPFHDKLRGDALSETIKTLKVLEAIVPPDHLKCFGKDNIHQMIIELAEDSCWNHLIQLSKCCNVWFPDHAAGSCISVERVVVDQNLEESRKSEIVRTLLGDCCWTLGTDGGKLSIQHAVETKQFKLIEILAKNGADVTSLSDYTGDTPIHAAVSISLREQRSDLVEALVERYCANPEGNRNLNPEQRDSEGNSLYHLLAKETYSQTSQHIKEYLCKKGISAKVADKSGKSPGEYLTGKSKQLLPLFLEVSKEKKEENKEKKEEKIDTKEEVVSKKDTKSSVISQMPAECNPAIQKESSLNYIRDFISSLQDCHVTDYLQEKGSLKSSSLKNNRNKEKDLSQTEEVNSQNTTLISESPKQTTCDEVIKKRKTLEEVAKETNDDAKEQVRSRSEVIEEYPDEPPPLESDDDVDYCKTKVTAQDNSDEQTTDDKAEYEEVSLEHLKQKLSMSQSYDVEITEEALKQLSNRHVDKQYKERILKDIDALAAGEWIKRRCKRLKIGPDETDSLELYESKISKGSRMIWELAVGFSSRLSDTTENGTLMYADKIRIWDFVFDHDNIKRAVENIKEKIKESHRMGQECILRKTLKGFKDNRPAKRTVSKQHPRYYTSKENSIKTRVTQEELEREWYPPASVNNTEYQVLKFHSFQSEIVSRALQNVNVHVQLPIEVSEKEYVIINLKENEAILLMGRSGTGKTTCALYRLWYRYYHHWSSRVVTEPKHGANEQDQDETDVKQIQEDDQEECNDPVDLKSPCEDNSVCNVENSMRQLFVTKNPVLAKEVRKTFCQFQNAHKAVLSIEEHNTDDLPRRLQDVGDDMCPLFLTLQRLLLMIDSSMENPFFGSTEDSSKQVTVAGWTDTDDTIFPLQDISFDSDDDNDDTKEDSFQETGHEEEMIPERQIITYETFTEEFWQKLPGTQKAAYHPSLVWMEIVSFITGSYQCLFNKDGYLSLQEYQDVGKKKANNFNGNREEVYQLFEQYRRWKRKQRNYVDENEIIRNIFQRLENCGDISTLAFDQIYVDETQDFTEAELYLLIKLSKNPNDMFFTGDTAQSIMRGIAFRFNDLKSLYHHARTAALEHRRAKTKIPVVNVPKQIYQLGYNYRSHSGICSLASGVLEILIRLFPESFDRLAPDKGLFPGPKPVIIESCEFSDLAIMLSGSKRETSNIEFGAHQVVIVVDDAARDAIPEELCDAVVLTIYESKGLEFDDVLLYNFFKDSQAESEWRVVTGIIEELMKRSISAPSDIDDVICIDSEVLSSENRPRPLIFDVNKHKILNTELKYLYTAITRARGNIWIYDEDRIKRAPMFEYFKAFQLVQSVSVTEEQSTFVKKSSDEEWNQSGDKFMEKRLYKPAAKCYLHGKNEQKRTWAMANAMALEAQRISKEDKKQKGQGQTKFIIAAEMFLKCNKLEEAAKCLTNAKEFQLAARLYEKLQMFEKSADIYKRCKEYEKLSLYYQRIDSYNEAVKVLFENGFYSQALEALQRFEQRKKELEMQNDPALSELMKNKPDQIYTEEKINKRAASLYRDQKNEKAMMKAVNCFLNPDDRVRFLLDAGHFEQAIHIMEDIKQFSEASSVCLKHGYTEKARYYAEKCTDKYTQAQHILEICKAAMSDPSSGNDGRQIFSDLESIVPDLQEKKDEERLGLVYLLQAIIQQNCKLALKAGNMFKKSHNVGGYLECCWVLQDKISSSDSELLAFLVTGIYNIFDACRTWMAGVDNNEWLRLCKFYGIVPKKDKASLVIFDEPSPFCPQVFKNDKTLLKGDLGKKMIRFLVEKTLSLLKPLKEALLFYREANLVCSHFSDGKECDSGESCPRMHSCESIDSLNKVINADILLILFEAYLGKRRELPKNFNDHLKTEMDVVFNDKPSNKSGELLVVDLLPYEGPSLPLMNNHVIKNALKRIRQSYYLRKYLVNFFKDIWKNEISGANSLKCKAVTDLSFAIRYDFFFKMFVLKDFREAKTPRKEIEAFTTKMKRHLKIKANCKKFGAFQIRSKDDTDTSIELRYTALDIIDACQLLVAKKPFDAFIAFVNAQESLFLNESCIHTDYSVILTWLEVFTLLAFLLIPRLHQERPLKYQIPLRYVELVSYIEVSWKTQIAQAVAEWKRKLCTRDTVLKLISKLCHLARVVSNKKLSDDVLALTSEHSRNYCFFERILILRMTLICNVKRLEPECTEDNLFSYLHGVSLEPKLPKRLHCLLNKAIKARQDKHATDIAQMLGNLLGERSKHDKLVWCALNVSGSIRKVTDVDTNYLSFEEAFADMRHLETSMAKDRDPTEMPIKSELETNQRAGNEIKENVSDIIGLEENKEKTPTESDFRKDLSEFVGNTNEFELERLESAEDSEAADIDPRAENTDNARYEELFLAFQVRETICEICAVEFFDMSENSERDKNDTDSTLAVESRYSVSLDYSEHDAVQIKNKTAHVRDAMHKQKDFELRQLKQQYNDKFKPCVSSASAFLNDIKDEQLPYQGLDTCREEIDSMNHKISQIQDLLRSCSTERNYKECCDQLRQYTEELDRWHSVVREHLKKTIQNETESGAGKGDAYQRSNNPDTEEFASILPVASEPKQRKYRTANEKRDAKKKTKTEKRTK